MGKLADPPLGHGLVSGLADQHDVSAPATRAQAAHRFGFMACTRGMYGCALQMDHACMRCTGTATGWRPLIRVANVGWFDYYHTAGTHTPATSQSAETLLL